MKRLRATWTMRSPSWRSSKSSWPPWNWKSTAWSTTLPTAPGSDGVAGCATTGSATGCGSSDAGGTNVGPGGGGQPAIASATTTARALTSHHPSTPSISHAGASLTPTMHRIPSTRCRVRTGAGRSRRHPVVLRSLDRRACGSSTAACRRSPIASWRSADAVADRPRASPRKPVVVADRGADHAGRARQARGARPRSQRAARSRTPASTARTTDVQAVGDGRLLRARRRREGRQARPRGARVVVRRLGGRDRRDPGPAARALQARARRRRAGLRVRRRRRTASCDHEAITRVARRLDSARDLDACRSPDGLYGVGGSDRRDRRRRRDDQARRPARSRTSSCTTSRSRRAARATVTADGSRGADAPTRGRREGSRAGRPATIDRRRAKFEIETDGTRAAVRHRARERERRGRRQPRRRQREREELREQRRRRTGATELGASRRRSRS